MKNSIYAPLRPTLVTAAVAVTSFAAVGVQAQELNGWCFPVDDCTGTQTPIENGSYGTCEGSCTLSDPVRIRGMDGTLFDQTCFADWMENGSQTQRVLVLKQELFSGDNKFLFVTSNETFELEQCN